MFAEGAQRLSDGFGEGLRGDLDGMLDALRIKAGDLYRYAVPCGRMVTSSSFLRYQIERCFRGHLAYYNVLYST